MIRSVGKTSKPDINWFRFAFAGFLKIDPRKVRFLFKFFQDCKFPGRTFPVIFPFLKKLLLLPHRQGRIHHARVSRSFDPDIILKVRLNCPLIRFGVLNILLVLLLSLLDLVNHVIHSFLLLAFFLIHLHFPFRFKIQVTILYHKEKFKTRKTNGRSAESKIEVNNSLLWGELISF